jgi:hypothetical protein
MIYTYTQTPPMVRAVQWDGQNDQDIIELLRPILVIRTEFKEWDDIDIFWIRIIMREAEFKLPTMITLGLGDWLVKHEGGWTDIYHNEEFQKIYKRVD